MPRRETVDIKSLRYVLYARKSTEDENRQVRSVSDQIRDCEKLARELGLNVVEIIKETKSAKRPGERPRFDQMLAGLESKKYDAILCWHPDRLCRNMLEGGKIINMLDEGSLQDIRFHSHQFSNDANGKMLLGMLFVFSKQYSDDLSDKVSRGVEGNFEEGKSSGAPKWGYDRSEVSGLYEPNKHFDAVKEAWVRRIAGDSLESITKFLNEKDVQRITKIPGKQTVIRPKLPTVSKMFQQTIYYGVLTQTEQTTDLRLIYDFKTMITEDDFNVVQAISYGRTRDKNKKKNMAFYPLRHFVYCAVCNSPKPMSVGKNLVGDRSHHVLSYECKNRSCNRKPRSLRAKHVFNSIYKVLDDFVFTDEAYKLYSAQIDALTGDKILKIKVEVQSLRGALAHVTKELEKRALNLGEIDKDSPVFVVNEKRVNELAIERDGLMRAIEQKEVVIANPHRIKLSKEQFLNLMKTAPDKMRAGSSVEKDVLCRILFLNLRVDNEKVAVYHWNEPFASLVKAAELSSGGREAKIVEPLNTIIDWLFDSQVVAWQKQLREVSQMRARSQIYSSRSLT